MKNSQELFNEIYNKYNKRIYMYIYRRVNDSFIAEEIMQETFIIFYEKIENDDIEISFKILLKIAKNLISNYYRKITIRNKKIEENFDDFSEDAIVDAKDLIDDIFTKDIEKHLEDLSDFQRKVFILTVIRKMKIKDVAKMLGKTETNIKQTTFKARKILQDNLEKEYPGIKERYRRVKKLQIFIAVIIGASLLSGMVYATIKTYDYFVNKSKTFTMEEKEIELDESSVKIKRNEAERRVEEYLKLFGIDDYDISKLKLEKDLIKDKVVWRLYNNLKFKIDIDANNGRIVRFNNIEEININNDKFRNININIEKLVKNIEETDEYSNIQNNKQIVNGNVIIERIYTNVNMKSYIFVEYLEKSKKIVFYSKMEVNIDNNSFISKDAAIKIVKEKFSKDQFKNIELYLTYENEIKELKEYEQENYVYYFDKETFYWRVEFNSGKNILINIYDGTISNLDDLNYEKKNK